MILKENELHGGTQVIHRFDNDYGASVVRHSMSYGGKDGLFEIGVIKFTGDSWDLCYDTPVTDDVLGHLTQPEVDVILNRIKQLK